jgi:hypothetical protein
MKYKKGDEFLSADGVRWTISSYFSDRYVCITGTADYVMFKESELDGFLYLPRMKQLENSPMKYKVGDILTSRTYNDRKIVHVVPEFCGYLFTVSGSRPCFDTQNELDEAGFALKSHELTVAEIESKLGMESGTLRIKK